MNVPVPSERFPWSAPNLLWSLSLDDAPELPDSWDPWRTAYAAATDQIVVWKASRIYVAGASGSRIIGLSAVRSFAEPVIAGSRLYVLDGAVLLCYELARLQAGDAPDGPDLAIDVLTPGARRFVRGDDAWASAQAALYPPASLPLPAFAPPLVTSVSGHDAVVVVATSGSVCALMGDFRQRVMVQCDVPDAAVARLQTVSGRTYVCYPAGNAVVTLDVAQRLARANDVVLPAMLANATGWIRAMNAREAAQPWIALQTAREPASVKRIGDVACLWNYDSYGAITLVEFGGGAYPQLGWDQMVLNAAPPMRSTTVMVHNQGFDAMPSGVPWIELDGPVPIAFVPTGGYRGAASLYAFAFPPFAADAALEQQWASMLPPSGNPGFMAQLVSNAPALASPPPAPDFITACGVADQCFEAGVDGTVTGLYYDN